MQELRYIDTHSHIHFNDFDADRAQMLSEMDDAGVGVIAVGTDIKTSRQVVELAREHSNVWACVGQHPNDHEDVEFSADKFRELLDNKDENKIVAIGECGLDYYREEERDPASLKLHRAQQKEVFKQQIELAIEYNLPLMLHIRSSDSTTDAHDDALEILGEYKAEHGDALHLHSHFATFGKELGEKFLELGATFGIPGVVTYKSAPELQELVKWLPLESMVVETDAPYAAPVPHRGKRNEPKFVINVVAYIAELRDESVDVVQKQILENSKRVFGIDINS